MGIKVIYLLVDYSGVIMRKFLTIFLLFTLVLEYSGCNTNNQTLRIVVNKKDIQYIQAKDLKEGDPANVFKLLLDKDASSTVEYIKIGEKVTLDFGDKYPDKIIMDDTLLRSNGEMLYTNKETVATPLEAQDTKYYFYVKKHKWSTLNSKSSNTDLRGFRIIASWDNTEYIFAFVIKTDAE